jgi:hypothetical protein
LSEIAISSDHPRQQRGQIALRKRQGWGGGCGLPNKRIRKGIQGDRAECTSSISQSVGISDEVAVLVQAELPPQTGDASISNAMPQMQ